MEVIDLQEQFQAVSDVLIAVGDPTRQGIIFTMLGLPCKTEGGAHYRKDPSITTGYFTSSQNPQGSWYCRYET